MVARLFLLIALLLPLPASAQDAAALEGSWALQIGGATIFRFDLESVPGEDEWRGTWSRPSRFASDGDNFAQLQLPPRQIESMAGLVFDGEVEISFPDPRPNAIPDIFRFRQIDADAVEMTYVGTGLAPYILERVAPDTPLGPYEKGATYSRLPPRDDPAPAPSPTSPGEAARIVPETTLEGAAQPGDLRDFRLPGSGPGGR